MGKVLERKLANWFSKQKLFRMIIGIFQKG